MRWPSISWRLASSPPILFMVVVVAFVARALVAAGWRDGRMTSVPMRWPALPFASRPAPSSLAPSSVAARLGCAADFFDWSRVRLLRCDHSRFLPGVLSGGLYRVVARVDDDRRVDRTSIRRATIVRRRVRRDSVSSITIVRWASTASIHALAAGDRQADPIGHVEIGVSAGLLDRADQVAGECPPVRVRRSRRCRGRSRRAGSASPELARSPDATRSSRYSPSTSSRPPTVTTPSTTVQSPALCALMTSCTSLPRRGPSLAGTSWSSSVGHLRPCRW